jgi:hypothetical protein
MINKIRQKPNEEDPRRISSRALIITLSAIGLGIAFLAVMLILSSCSASVGASIRQDGGGRLAIQAEVPSALSAKFRKLAAGGSSASASGPFFDAASIRKSVAARPGLSVLSLEQPTPDSIKIELEARDLASLAASPDIKGSRLLSIKKGEDWTEASLRLDKASAKAALSLMQGLDPDLMEALSPPALDEEPITAAEYKTMLKSVLGEKAMPAIESASVTIKLSAPGAVIGSGGGSLSGSTLTATIPTLTIMCLEKPIEIWLRWKK